MGRTADGACAVRGKAAVGQEPPVAGDRFQLASACVFHQEYPVKSFVLITAFATLLPSLCLAQGGRAVDFDLVCAAKAADGAELAPVRTFHVQMTEDNDATMMEKGVSTPINEGTHTYVNAYLWEADGVKNYFDRFKGTLTTEPKTFTWTCSKVGGQKF